MTWSGHIEKGKKMKLNSLASIATAAVLVVGFSTSTMAGHFGDSSVSYGPAFTGLSDSNSGSVTSSQSAWFQFPLYKGHTTTFTATRTSGSVYPNLSAYAGTGSTRSSLGALITQDVNAASSASNSISFNYTGIGPASTTGTFEVSHWASESGGFNATMSIANAGPTGDAGGPYTIGLGDDLNLAGSGSDADVFDILSFAWDLDGDSIFDDAFGATSTITAATLGSLLGGPGLYNLAMQVTDNLGASFVDTVTLLIEGVPGPGALALLGVGLIGFGAARSRKR